MKGVGRICICPRSVWRSLLRSLFKRTGSCSAVVVNYQLRSKPCHPLTANSRANIIKTASTATCVMSVLTWFNVPALIADFVLDSNRSQTKVSMFMMASRFVPIIIMKPTTLCVPLLAAVSPLKVLVLSRILATDIILNT